MLEQDAAYQQSLEVDRAKVRSIVEDNAYIYNYYFFR